MKRANEILQSLRERGHRITKARKMIVEIFSGSTQPIAATEIIAELARRRVAANKATVYRELAFLEAESFVQEIDLLEGQKRYELHEPEHHHHHLVCRKCSDIRCIDLPHDLDQLEAKISKQHRFKIEHHVLEFFGLCDRCR